MQRLTLIIALLLSLTITGCSILEDFIEDDPPPTRPDTEPLNSEPPTMRASQNGNTFDGELFASCWLSTGATLCVDRFNVSGDWFAEGEFLTATSASGITLEFIEGRGPDSVTVSVYAEFPPSTVLETIELIPTAKRVTWQPTNLPVGDYYVSVFGIWDNGAATGHYDAVYFVPVRIQ